MAQMTGGQALMRSLYLEGVRVILGCLGCSCITRWMPWLTSPKSGS